MKDLIKILELINKYYPMPKSEIDLIVTYNCVAKKLFISVIKNNYLMGAASIFNKRAGISYFEDVDIKRDFSKSDYNELERLVKGLGFNVSTTDIKKSDYLIIGIMIQVVNGEIKNYQRFRDDRNFHNYNFSEKLKTEKLMDSFLSDDPNGDKEKSELNYMELRESIANGRTSCPIFQKVYYEELPKWLGRDSFTISYAKGRTKTIKINYAPLTKKRYGFYAAVYPMMTTNKNIIGWKRKTTSFDLIAEPECKLIVAPAITTLPKLVIDTVIAHELTHVIRLLNNAYSSQMYGESEFWQRFEEFMADRGIKEQLASVKEIYQNRFTRKIAIEQSHKYLLGRPQLTFGPITHIAQFLDRLVAFSVSNEID